jgi:DNA modification methylase
LPEAAAELLEAGLVYAPKPSRREKNCGLPDDYDAKRNPCAKPVALCAYLAVLATAEGQTVLDPFCGEGPVGVAAALMKRGFVGIELEKDFAETARLRIAEATEACGQTEPQEGLFAACK